jgi:molecular chaperone GrpE (heat shock protein)
MLQMEQNNIEEIRKKAEKFESQYNKLRQEFKDYIETNRRNEELKKQELRIDSAKKILVVADSLSRISAAYNNISCDIVKSYSENLKKNVDVIYSQLLSASGLTPIKPATGDMFDDRMHIAVGLESGTTYPENSVFRVIRKGYRIENNIARPAEVIISKHPVEVIKIAKPSLWNRVLNWISPPKHRFSDINQRIDEFERLQKENVGKLTQDITSLKNMTMQLDATNQKICELERIQKEENQRFRQDMVILKNTIIELEAKNKKVNELEQMQEEKFGRLIQEISSLRDMIIELEENNALKKQPTLQRGDIPNNEEQCQGNDASKSDGYQKMRDKNYG